jgi:hypothetical protein
MMPIGHASMPSTFLMEPSKLDLVGLSRTNFEPVLFLLDGLVILDALDALDKIDTASSSSFSLALAAALSA